MGLRLRCVAGADLTALSEIPASTVRELASQPYRFGEFVDLTNRLIKQPLDLSGLTLCGLDLSGTVLEDQVCFDGATLKGLSWFRGVRFLSGASFKSACFFSDARFDDSEFILAASFEAAEFRGIATYDRCKSHMQLAFDGCMFNGNFSVAGAQFDEAITLVDSVMMGGFWREGVDNDRLADANRCEIFGRLSG